MDAQEDKDLKSEKSVLSEALLKEPNPKKSWKSWFSFGESKNLEVVTTLNPMTVKATVNPLDEKEKSSNYLVDEFIENNFKSFILRKDVILLFIATLCLLPLFGQFWTMKFMLYLSYMLLNTAMFLFGGILLIKGIKTIFDAFKQRAQEKRGLMLDADNDSETAIFKKKEVFIGSILLIMSLFFVLLTSFKINSFLTISFFYFFVLHSWSIFADLIMSYENILKVWWKKLKDLT